MRGGGRSNVCGVSIRSPVKARLSRGIEPADAFRVPFIRCETRLLSSVSVRSWLRGGRGSNWTCMRTYSIAWAAALDRIDMFGTRLLRLRIRRTSTRQYTLLETESPSANAAGHCANFPGSLEYRSAARGTILGWLIEFVRTARRDLSATTFGNVGERDRSGTLVQSASATLRLERISRSS